MSSISTVKRNVYLDYMRAISALLVILYHYTWRYENLFGHIHSYQVVIQYGGRAVAVFFLLTGYLAVKNIKQRTPIQYGVDRFIRIFPVYWVCVLITFLLCSLFLPSRSVSVKDLVINFTMVPNLLGAEFVDGAYWTLQHQLIFWCIICLICAFHLHRHTDKIAVAWLILFTALRIIPDTAITITIKKACNVFLICNQYGAAFVSGILVANLELAYRESQKNNHARLVLIILALIWSIILCLLGPDQAFAVYLVVSIVVLFISIMLANRGIFPNSIITYFLKPLELIAVVSYPLYLLHQNIGYIIIQRIERIGLSSELFVIIPVGGGISSGSDSSSVYRNTSIKQVYKINYCV